jgi:hypothetical protein
MLNSMMKSTMYVLLTVCLIGSSQAKAADSRPAGEHPYYLHALSDLRAARWMIQHRPGNWAQTVDEVEAVRRIDAAIGEIKKAAIDDRKNLEDHPAVDERNDHDGRLHVALDFLRKARQDISQMSSAWAAMSDTYASPCTSAAGFFYRSFKCILIFAISSRIDSISFLIGPSTSPVCSMVIDCPTVI